MKQSFLQSDIINQARARLRMSFGFVEIIDEDIRSVINSAGVRLNQSVNDSDSKIYCVDSITEDEVSPQVNSGQYQNGEAAVVAGNNVITLDPALPNSNYVIIIRGVFASDGTQVFWNEPENLTSTQFEIYSADTGTLKYTVIRN